MVFTILLLSFCENFDRFYRDSEESLMVIGYVGEFSSKLYQTPVLFVGVDNYDFLLILFLLLS